MTAGEVLGLVEGLSICDIRFSDEDITEMLYTPLVELGCVQSSIQGKSGCSIEVGYDAEEKSYTVRVLTPSTRADWEIAIELIQKIAQRCTSVVVDEAGIRYRSGIITYDYKKDILGALDSHMLYCGKGLIFHAMH